MLQPLSAQATTRADLLRAFDHVASFEAALGSVFAPYLDRWLCVTAGCSSMTCLCVGLAEFPRRRRRGFSRCSNDLIKKRSATDRHSQEWR
jgi:hypothetical protein